MTCSFSVDIDYDSSGTSNFPERDQLYFNDKPVDYLYGKDGTWVVNSFAVDVADVNFGIPQPDGSVKPGVNTLRVDIDVQNVGICECWCMSIDWVSLTGTRAHLLGFHVLQNVLIHFFVCWVLFGPYRHPVISLSDRVYARVEQQQPDLGCMDSCSCRQWRPILCSKSVAVRFLFFFFLIQETP
jgi:hypothetical protein